jgi:hypothetical protein
VWAIADKPPAVEVEDDGIAVGERSSGKSVVVLR